jgi:osmotically-inducible protein OsmY
MEPIKHPATTPAAAQFAKPDTAKGHDLKQRIIASLRNRNRDLQQIQVCVFGGTVVVRGQLRSLNEKRSFLEDCRVVPGVMRIVDELIVADDSPVRHDPEQEPS